jgi:hypothetical protein
MSTNAEACPDLDRPVRGFRAAQADQAELTRPERGGLRGLFSLARPRQKDPARAPSIAVIGDRLDCLTALRSAPEAHAFHSVHSVWGRHRAVVIGVDISWLRTRKQLRASLRDIEVQCAMLCGRLTRLEHISLVLNGSSVISEDSVLRICDSVARRIHNRLEQACARSIVITAILAEHCDDSDRLAARVIARARERESLDAGIALHWKEIAHISIGAAGMNTYL